MLKVIIVAENTSTRMGGEAILPYHYFRLLAARDVDVRLVTHERVREELEVLLPEFLDKIEFVPRSRISPILWKLGTLLPQRVAEVTFFYWVHLLGIFKVKKIAKQLTKDFKPDVIHQPVPVSPKMPSIFYGMGAPVVIGPMNGGMDFPPAFAKLSSRSEKIAIMIGRSLSNTLNKLIPGKRDAALLLVANPRTKKALPACATKTIIEIVENGVDLSQWSDNQKLDRDKIVFTYVGRLVDWKGLDYLLRAFASLLEKNYILEIIGGGPELKSLKNLAIELSIEEKVRFLGFVDQREIPQLLTSSRALVLPSVFECGGAVVLEAMALSVPVIATNWGGPADYINDDCGILVEPSSKDEFEKNFATAIDLLGQDEMLAKRMGTAGRLRVEECFSWDKKIDAIIQIYRQAASLN
jgi:glycosyltransferase involved in cell wall biosynthesis